MKSKHYDAVIVGAGLSGLSCAYYLTAKGKRVIVLEAHPYAGGRTSSFDDGGMQVESGLHRYIGYYSALPRLLKKCGVKLSDIVTWEEKADILVKGEKKKLVLGLAPLFGPIKAVRGLAGNRDVLSRRDKLSLLPFFFCSFASYFFSDRLDRYSVTEYARSHGVSQRARRLILEPLSSGIFFLPPENYSAYAFFGLFAPAIPKFYKMRIGAFLGGMSEVMCDPIVRTLKNRGASFRFGERVSELIVQDGGVVGAKTELGTEYRADNTVIATTLPEAKRLFSPLREQHGFNTPELDKLFRLPHMSACTLQLELDRPALEKDITAFGPGTDMVSFAEQSRTTFRGSKGRLSVILGNAKENAQKSTDELVKIVTEQMESLGVHISGSIRDARKVAEEDEFYSLSPMSQRLRPRQNTGVSGAVLAGDYTLTRSFATMEGAVLSGEAAAKAVLENHGNKVRI